MSLASAEPRPPVHAVERAALLRELQGYVAQNPGSPGGVSKLAVVLYSIGDDRRTGAWSRRALNLMPGSGRLRELVLYSAMRAEETPVPARINLARRCLITTPGSTFALKTLGTLLRNSGAVEAGRTQFTRSRCLDPNDPTTAAQLWKIDGDWGWGGRGVVGDVHIVDGGKDNDARFYRTTSARFFPQRLAQFDDLDRVLRDDIFHGYLPDHPLIDAGRPIIAMGSCFAQHIRRHLLSVGRQSEHVPVPEGLNNTFAIRQFIDWVEGGEDLAHAFEKGAGGQMTRWDTDKERQPFRRAMQAAGGFIATIGVAEVWRDRRTGGVFWRGIPETQFDPAIHEHALSTVEENADNLRAIAAGLRRLSGEAPVVFTLSPVPLIATMRTGTSIFAADAVSKSTLRLAIEAVMRDPPEGVYYWPSFEALRWLGGHLERRLYDGEANPRHPSPDIIERVVSLFVDHFMEPGDRT